MNAYRQKMFAGDYWFLWIGVVLAAIIMWTTFADGFDWIDVALVGLYFIVLVGTGIVSATYPDIRISREEFAFRNWFWYSGVAWDAIEEIHPYPIETPNGLMILVRKGRLRKIIVRRNSIERFDELFDELRDVVPEERWVGWIEDD
ncbi:MAG: hypothetical protein GY771_10765 [bacterium]|nr:hypothetical protein [bacterium]